MSQINPRQAIEQDIIQVGPFSEVQQVGIDLTISQSITIEHGRCFNVLFNETIALPKDVFATIHQRSSYSRKGVFITTGIYDPGYTGSLGCTIYNMSGGTINIEVNTRIAQIVCFEADAASEYNGQYQNK